MQKLNTLSNWKYESHSGTFLNGTTGWLTGTISYNSDMYIASINGWIKFPGNVAVVSTNPLDGVLNGKGLPVIGSAYVGAPNGQNNYSPFKFNNQGQLEVEGGTGDQWNKNTNYEGWVSMVFIGPRSQMKV